MSGIAPVFGPAPVTLLRDFLYCAIFEPEG